MEKRGRRGGETGDQREARGRVLGGGGVLEQIQQEEGEQPASLPTYPPPTDGSLAKKIKFIAWKEEGGSM